MLGSSRVTTIPRIFASCRGTSRIYRLELMELWSLPPRLLSTQQRGLGAGSTGDLSCGARCSGMGRSRSWPVGDRAPGK